MRVETAIVNGRVVRPQGIAEQAIAVNDGRIVAISNDPSDFAADRTIDASGKYVLPGLIDTHVHIGWPDWPFDEATQTTTKAAAAGGVTTILNYLIEPESLVKAIREKREIYEQNAYVDAGFHGLIFSEKNIDEIPEMAEEGVRSFKFFIPYRGPEAVPPMVGIDDGIIYFGFEKIAKLAPPRVALFHAENIEVFFKYKEKFIREGGDNFTWHDTRPNFSEVESIRRVAYFSKVTGCPVYYVHMSVREGPEEILRARAEGVNMTGETCPQYLTLTKTAHRVLSKVNPPLRDVPDQNALWEGLRSGIIECVGTDHAECATKHKQEFWSAIVGFSGVQTLLPVMLSEGVNKGRISLEKLVQVTSYNNARTFGLLPKKGTLDVGADADLVIVDLDKKTTLRAKDLYHLSDFSVYEGMEVTGGPVLTMVRGKVVMEDGEIVAKAPLGQFVPVKAQA